MRIEVDAPMAVPGARSGTSSGALSGICFGPSFGTRLVLWLGIGGQRDPALERAAVEGNLLI
jgi:hypothetical protein